MPTNTSGPQDSHIRDAEDFGKLLETAGLGDKVTDTVKALVTIIEELDATIDNLVEEKKTLTDENSDLQKERNDLQQQVSDLQDKLDNADQKIRDLS